MENEFWRKPSHDVILTGICVCVCVCVFGVTAWG